MHGVTTTMTGLADDELVERARMHDASAFAELVGRTTPNAIRQATRILGNREAAEDEVQNSYLKAWQHVVQFQGQSKFSTWISRIVVNQCLMRLRKLRLLTIFPLDASDGEDGFRPLTAKDLAPTPEAACDRAEQYDLLRREIRRLPAIFRDVLILRDIEELSMEQTANRLRISTSAVKTRLMRARCKLRSRLQANFPPRKLSGRDWDAIRASDNA